MPRRRKHWSVGLAMLAGILAGLWMLSTLDPRTPEPRRTAPPVARAPEAPVVRPAPRRITSEPLAPADEDEAPDDDGPSTVTDTAEPDDAMAWIEVRYEDADGYVVDDAWGGLTGCSIDALERRRDGFEARVVAGERCQAIAFRRDGLLQVRAEPLEFDAEPGMVATLVFPAERTGGIGIQFEPSDGGMMVVAVLPGTPADLAGLVPGDVVIGVGGVPVADLNAREFIEEMTGPEGSDVEFELEFEADTGISYTNVTLTRAFLSG